MSPSPAKPSLSKTINARRFVAQVRVLTNLPFTAQVRVLTNLLRRPISCPHEPKFAAQVRVLAMVRVLTNRTIALTNLLLLLSLSLTTLAQEPPGIMQPNGSNLLMPRGAYNLGFRLPQVGATHSAAPRLLNLSSTGSKGALVYDTTGSRILHWNGTTWQPVATPFTTADARNSISLTTTGTSGAATYTPATGVLNIPNYQSGWGLTGNAGTNSATNFLGTPDNQSLVFRTNNIERFRIENNISAFQRFLFTGNNSIFSIGVGNLGGNFRNRGMFFNNVQNAASLFSFGAPFGPIAVITDSTFLDPTFSASRAIRGINSGLNVIANMQGASDIGYILNTPANFIGSFNNVYEFRNAFSGTRLAHLGVYGNLTFPVGAGGSLQLAAAHDSVGIYFRKSVTTPFVATGGFVGGFRNTTNTFFVGPWPETAEPSAALQVTYTNRGILPSRLTAAQRDAIASPATALTLYCTDCTANDASTGVMQTYTGTVWKNHW